MRFGLRQKSVIVITVLIVVVTTVLSAVFISRSKRIILDSLRDRGVTLSRTLAYNSEFGVLTSNRELLQSMIGGVMSESDVAYARVYNAKGEVLARDGLPVRIPARPPGARGVIAQLLSVPDIGAYYDISVPITSESRNNVNDELGIFSRQDGLLTEGGEERAYTEEVIGRVHLGILLDNALVLIGDTRRHVLFIAVSSIAVAALLTILLTGLAVKPIQQLVRATGQVAAGDLHVKVPVSSVDEIGELAMSFNTMVDDLKRLIQKERELAAARQEVEAERKKTEELQVAYHELEQANLELDSFVYTASHDLRTPLRGISSFAGFLEDDYRESLDDKGRHYLTKIRRGVQLMEQLIDDLLTVSRVSRQHRELEDVSVNELVESLRERIETDITQYKVNMVVQPDMPRIWCDRIKMAEVLVNLINNAIKFSSKNTNRDPLVEIGCREDGDRYRLFVKDNGIGIDPQYHRRIFDIFERLHTSSEYEGTGAGLSIVKRVIDEHYGSIWVESSPGEGATFFFAIPKKERRKQYDDERQKNR